MTTLYFSHPAFLNHDTGAGHPERADRMRAIEKAMSDEAFATLIRREAPMVDLDKIRLAHDSRYIEALEAASPKDGFIYLDPDTIMSPGTWEAALRAVGGVVAATDAVMTGEATNAFCATRPPGHHAEARRAYGFCLFNNVVIAALHARLTYGIERAAVVDFDVHHGNGTQAMFWREKNMFYASTHQMPLFPGTGSPLDVGEYNNIVNAPLSAGDGGAQFREAFETRILPALDRFMPDLLIISAGFDAHRDDPLGGVMLNEEDFAWVTAKLIDVAAKHAGSRVVSVLEGGYNLRGLSQSVAAHISVLMGKR